MPARMTEIVIDATDPARLADFWAGVLGWEQVPTDDEDEVGLADPAGRQPALLFVPVPETKSAKNRLHFDVNPVGVTQAAELQRLLDLGARHLDIGQGEQTWIVLTDPEGNEFCLLRTTVD